jgi:drug/metabolite transporter (DMT)-like permease
LSSAAGIIPLLLFASLLGERIIPGDWTAVLLLALTSQIIGQGLLIWSLPHFSALVVGLTLLSQPAIAAVAGWLLYEERLGPIDFLGGLMVAVAIVLIRLPQRQGSATAEQAR